jgi:4-hydroxy-3-polyprenylbenzoate decarboxylase
MTLPLVVGISGASGAIYGVEMVQTLKRLGHPVHLTISDAAARTLAIETEYGVDDLGALANAVHKINDVGAIIASGSFQTLGMAVTPCSMKTLSGVANGYADNLLIRAADVTLKERRPLVLMVRETPLHKGHLQLMQRALELGALILPPMPAFYHRPKTITDIVQQTIGRVLDHFAIEHDLGGRWRGG